MLIRFNLEENYLQCWIKGYWHVHEFFVRISKWTLGFQGDSETSRPPIWIALESLSIYFFKKSALFSIAKAVGDPLKIDLAITKLSRPKVAQVCVEVDLCADFPS